MLRQGIREISLLQKYPIGYRFAEKGGIGDRVFRYCLADLAIPKIVGRLGAAAMGDTLHETATAVVAYAGDQDLTVVIATTPHLDTGYTKDQFKDGYLNIWTTITQVCLKIKGNEKDDGTNVVLHLEEPLLYDVAAGSGVDMHENLYKSVHPMDGGGFQSVVAVALVPVTIGYHFWGQTWGPIICTGGFVDGAGESAGVGKVVNERAVYFQDDGSIGSGSDLNPATGFQLAGFVLPTTRNAVPVVSDDIFFMLQLSP